MTTKTAVQHAGRISGEPTRYFDTDENYMSADLAEYLGRLAHLGYVEGRDYFVVCA